MEEYRGFKLESAKRLPTGEYFCSAKNKENQYKKEVYFYVGDINDINIYLKNNVDYLMDDDDSD